MTKITNCPSNLQVNSIKQVGGPQGVMVMVVIILLITIVMVVLILIIIIIFITIVIFIIFITIVIFRLVEEGEEAGLGAVGQAGVGVAELVGGDFFLQNKIIQLDLTYFIFNLAEVVGGELF